MKKLLGLLAVAPLSLAACGDVKAEPIVDNDTVVEIHEDKAHLMEIYKVQDFVATATHVTPMVYYFIDAKAGVDLSDWTFEMTIEQEAAVPQRMRTYGLAAKHDVNDVVIDNEYYFDHDLNIFRQHDITLVVSEVEANAKGILAKDVLDFHADEDRAAEKQAAVEALGSTATAAERAAVFNKYAYKDSQSTPVVGEDFYKTLKLHGIKGDDAAITTDLKTITA